MLYACRRLALVDTSALGEFAPSLGRNTAASPSPSSYTPPSVSSNVSCSCLGVIVQPVVGTWQLTQRRPLLPRSWKNSFSRSMKPRELTVVNTPVASCTGTLFASRLWLSQCRAVTSSNVLAASPSNVLTRSSSLLAWLASGPAWVPDTSATGAWPSTSLASFTSPVLSVQPVAAQNIPPSQSTASVFMPSASSTSRADIPDTQLRDIHRCSSARAGYLRGPGCTPEGPGERARARWPVRTDHCRRYGGAHARGGGGGAVETSSPSPLATLRSPPSIPCCNVTASRGE